jgi:hypothetical protein
MVAGVVVPKERTESFVQEILQFLSISVETKK